jgi:hypothetical protein
MGSGKSGGWPGKFFNSLSAIAVVANGFDRAAFKGLHAKCNFFLGRRLLVHKGVTPFVIAGEKAWRGFAAEIAVDALLIDEKLARSI